MWSWSVSTERMTLVLFLFMETLHPVDQQVETNSTAPQAAVRGPVQVGRLMDNKIQHVSSGETLLCLDFDLFFVAYCVADLVVLLVLVISKKRKPLTTGIVSSEYVTHQLLILCFRITNWEDSFETDHSNKRSNRAHWLFSASANQLPLLLLNLWFIWKMCLTHGEMSWDVNKDSVRPVCLHSWSCAGVKPSTEVRNDKHWCRGAARNQTTRSPQLRIS